MLSKIAQKWWVLLIKGICAILFGVFAIAWPGITLWSLVILYGAFVLADGIMAIALGIAGHERGRAWWGMILVGILGIAAGVITFIWPGLTALVLLIIIASWAIVRGVFEIIGAIKLRKVIDDEWIMVLSGLFSIAFGVLLLLRPAAGALAVVLLIGAFMIAIGIMAIALSLRLRGLNEKLAAKAAG
jgi:uncharacterized membrane protein HdeD (DUF308 family)